MKTAYVKIVDGPVVKATGMKDFQVREMVVVGEKKLIGEVTSIEGDLRTIQVHEGTEGLKRDEEIQSTGAPLNVKLGPDMVSNIFDGIQRPLKNIRDKHSNFMPEEVGLISLNQKKLWPMTLTMKKGDFVQEGEIFGTVPETDSMTHRLLIPIGVSGTIEEMVEEGSYNIGEALLRVKDEDDKVYEVKMAQEWPVRVPHPVKHRKATREVLLTGQRVLDTFFPVARGGACAAPGGFGTGKTMTQHQIVEYYDASLVIYIGCEERGSEVAEVLEDFPNLVDPYTRQSLMNRTILIANTSNMPVVARETSIYTGVTMAEYSRDQGYDVALMTDSTSRWAEALREISGCLKEMPAEEGYPAYLPSQVVGFCERTGSAETFSGEDGSVTLIGAISPVGENFSEPVTENTKRFVNVFLALDKDLTYARHYPAAQWMTSYSQCISNLKSYYELILGGDLVGLRDKCMDIFHQEVRLNEIILLVGEEILPDDQRLLLAITRVLKVGFLQQDAFNRIDTFVPLEKQYNMLKTIDHLYEVGKKALSQGTPIRQIKNGGLFGKIINMRYNIENDDKEALVHLNNEADNFYEDLVKDNRG